MEGYQWHDVLLALHQILDLRAPFGVLKASMKPDAYRKCVQVLVKGVDRPVLAAKMRSGLGVILGSPHLAGHLAQGP